MTPHPAARIGIALGSAAVVGGALLGVGSFATAATSATDAAWTDRAHASAAVSAGTWAVAPVGSTCVALNNGGNAVGTCTVKSIRYEEWGTAGNHTRNYYLSFTVSDPSPTKSIRVDVNLSSATGTTTGTGTWSWATAATLPSGQFTPSSTCASLPRLQGVTISGWDWSTSPHVFFSATDNRAGTAGASQSCK